MTIVVWDGQYLAADQRITYGKTDDEFMVDHGQKLYRHTGQITIKESPLVWIGMAGLATNAGKFIGLLNKAEGELIDFTKSFGVQLSHPGFTLICITANGQCAVMEFKAIKGLFKPIVAMKTKLPVMIGSGSKISVLCDSLGLTDSRLAVQLGILSDRSCGGDVVYVTPDTLYPQRYTQDNSDQAKAMIKRMIALFGMEASSGNGESGYWGF